MRLIFDNYGWGTGSTGNFQGIILPIGQNLKQPARLVEVGTAYRMLVTASRNGSFIADAQVNNIFDGMVIDMSAFALMFPDVYDQVRQDTIGSTDYYDLIFTYYYSEGGQNVMTIPVYPLGCARLGFTGGTGGTNTYNYAREAGVPVLENLDAGPALVVNHGEPIAGFNDGVEGVITPTRADGYAFDAKAGYGYSGSKDNCTISMIVRNFGTTTIIAVPFNQSAGIYRIPVEAGVTKVVSAPFNLRGADKPRFAIFGQQGVVVDVIVSRLMVNKGDCPQPYTLHVEDQRAAVNKGYMGYLTDYRDGYFNYMYWPGDDGLLNGWDGYPNKTGRPMVNRIFFATADGATSLACNPIDANGNILGGSINRASGWCERVGSEPDAMHDRVYLRANGDMYGVERYKKKDYHNEPQTNKVALRWLNSRGMFDSMFFVDFTLTPKLTEVGTVDSYDIVVKTKITWDNEEALYYLTRSPNIQAITPVDIAQWGVATSESNGVFALNGGNVGKTLTLKFNYKIFGI